MVSPIASPITTAVSALKGLQNRVAADANSIASGGAPQGGDITSSIVDLMATKALFKANADVIKTADQMNRQALDIFT